MPRWPAGLHQQAGGQPARRGFARIPARPSQEQYTMIRQARITDDSRQTVLDSNGAGTVSWGPQGLGTVWYPTQFNVWTTTGAFDTATVSVYLNQYSVGNLLIASAVNAGRNTIGYNGPPLAPGALITAVWENGHAGDVASILVSGEAEVASNW